MARRVKLTKRVVEGEPAPTGGKQTVLWDTETTGFGVRVGARSRTYFVRYKPGAGGRHAKAREYTIGKHGQPWTVDAARKEARRILGDVAGGKDPQADRQGAREAQAWRQFGDVADAFQRKHVQRNLKPKTVREYGYIINRILVPAFKNRDIAEIERADIAAALDKYTNNPATERFAFSVARSLFGWAAQRGIVDVNPCRDMKAPPSPAARDRVLSDYELALLWRATADMSLPYGAALRLLAITGQRRAEVEQAEWDELDLGAGVWRIPASRTKNSKPHEVDLPPLALEILDGLPRLGRYVFTTTGKSPIANMGREKRRLDARMAELAHADGADAPAPWVVHDLRRTCASGLAYLGVAPHVVEKLLNHSSGRGGSLVAVYQRYDYRAERRAAVEAWDAYLRQLIGRADGDNVVAFPGGG